MKCFFCKFSKEPDYKEVDNLEKFLTPRKKIVNRDRSKICAKHQQTMSKHIKHARFLGLLPYTSYQNIN